MLKETNRLNKKIKILEEENTDLKKMMEKYEQRLDF